jgi:hypothetical protein
MYVPDTKRIVLYVCTAYLVLDFSFYASGMTSPSSLRSPLRSLAVGFSVGLILTLCFTDLRSCSRHRLDAYWYFGGVSDVVASRPDEVGLLFIITNFSNLSRSSSSSFFSLANSRRLTHTPHIYLHRYHSCIRSRYNVACRIRDESHPPRQRELPGFSH